MNDCKFTGRLTRDPEIRYTQSNMACANFSLAVDRDFQKQGEEKKADFFDFTAFGKIAEAVEKFFRKGSKMIVTKCRAQQNSYQNREGQKVNKVVFIVDNFEFGDSKMESTVQQTAPQQSRNSGYSQPQQRQQYQQSRAMSDNFMDVPTGIDDELPFM